MLRTFSCACVPSVGWETSCLQLLLGTPHCTSCFGPGCASSLLYFSVLAVGMGTLKQHSGLTMGCFGEWGCCSWVSDPQGSLCPRKEGRYCPQARWPTSFGSQWSPQNVGCMQAAQPTECDPSPQGSLSEDGGIAIPRPSRWLVLIPRDRFVEGQWHCHPQAV